MTETTPPAHVLIVEDSFDVSTAYRILFEAKGYRTSTAASVASAVQTGMADPVDLMLLDLTLPDGSGLDVLAALRGAGAAPRVSVALTGHDDEATAKRCREAGCSEVLVKPVPPRQLLGRMGEWLGTSTAKP